MRFVVEVLPTDAERVEGTVLHEGLDEPLPFCGWLELLRLLEPDAAAGESRTGRDARSHQSHPPE